MLVPAKILSPHDIYFACIDNPALIPQPALIPLPASIPQPALIPLPALIIETMEGETDAKAEQARQEMLHPQFLVYLRGKLGAM